MSQQVLKCFAFWYYNFLYSPFPHPNSKLCFLLMGWVWGWGRGSVLYSLGNDSCPAVHKKHTPPYPTHERTDRQTEQSQNEMGYGNGEIANLDVQREHSLTRYLFHQLCWGSTRMRRNLNKLASDKCNTLTWRNCDMPRQSVAFIFSSFFQTLLRLKLR